MSRSVAGSCARPLQSKCIWMATSHDKFITGQIWPVPQHPVRPPVLPSISDLPCRSQGFLKLTIVSSVFLPPVVSSMSDVLQGRWRRPEPRVHAEECISSRVLRLDPGTSPRAEFPHKCAIFEVSSRFLSVRRRGHFKEYDAIAIETKARCAIV